MSSDPWMRSWCGLGVREGRWPRRTRRCITRRSVRGWGQNGSSWLSTRRDPSSMKPNDSEPFTWKNIQTTSTDPEGNPNQGPLLPVLLPLPLLHHLLLSSPRIPSRLTRWHLLSCPIHCQSTWVCTGLSSLSQDSTTEGWMDWSATILFQLLLINTRHSSVRPLLLPYLPIKTLPWPHYIHLSCHLIHLCLPTQPTQILQPLPSTIVYHGKWFRIPIKPWPKCFKSLAFDSKDDLISLLGLYDKSQDIYVLLVIFHSCLNRIDSSRLLDLLCKLWKEE